jgi:hypothetical protein
MFTQKYIVMNKQQDDRRAISYKKHFLQEKAVDAPKQKEEKMKHLSDLIPIFLGDVRREFMQRLIFATTLYGTWGSYLRDAFPVCAYVVHVVIMDRAVPMLCHVSLTCSSYACAVFSLFYPLF